MPKWAAELRESLAGVQELVLAHEADLSSTKKVVFQHSGLIGEQKAAVERLCKSQIDLRERLGTSTSLIIWNIAVLIAIAYLYCKAYVPGTP